jgi:SAM-dependent methyltransferase
VVVSSRVYDHRGVVLHRGDCLDVLSTLGDASVDSVVTDPPYALEFMGKTWDKYTPASYQAWCEKWATECLRVLKPGGHLLAFGGTRTAHRLACGIEDAGFELRDTITWAYASGFPKSHDIGKAIDRRPGVTKHAEFGAMLKAARIAKGYTNSFDVAELVTGHRTGAVANWEKYQFPETKWWPALKGLLNLDSAWDGIIAEADREVRGMSDELLGRKSGIGNGTSEHYTVGGTRAEAYLITAPATEAAKQWDGWGTALKPASEPIIVARKPLKGTVAQNVLTYGTGGMNIDGCRVQTAGAVDAAGYAAKCASVVGLESNRNGAAYGEWSGVRTDSAHAEGRWPSNLVLSHASTVDGEDACADGCVPGCPVSELDAQSGDSKSTVGKSRGSASPGHGWGMTSTGAEYQDSGGASRFYPVFRYQAKAPTSQRPVFDGRSHATVKPLALMRWLVRLVTPPGGLVLDPLCGTGTTGQAARDEGMRAVLIDSDLDSIRWAIVRLEKDSPSVAVGH